MERDGIQRRADQSHRRWAVEQIMGALMPGNNATVEDIIKRADTLADYVMNGKPEASE